MAYSGHEWKAYDDGKTFEDNFDNGGVGRHDWLNEMEKGIRDGQNTATPTVDTLSGATTVGKAVMKAKDAAAGRSAIGAGVPYTYTLPDATTGAIGGVKKMAAQSDSTATDVAGLVTDFNALLAKLKAAGHM